MTRRRLFLAVGLLVVVFLLVQLFPVGAIFVSMQRVEDPPARQTFDWPTADAADITRRACYDCHSNETVWPWYANIAPGSWLMTRHVNNGRAVLNFSEIDFEAVADASHFMDHARWHIYNDMPPRPYLLLHPDANLTDAQRELVLSDLETLLGMND